MKWWVLAACICAANIGVTAQQASSYTHDKTGVVFSAPANWRYVATVHLLDGGDQIQWSVPGLDVVVYVWIIGEERDAATIAQRLDAAVDAKIAQRRSSNYRNYDIRRDTVRRITIDGNPAMTATAQFDVGPTQHAVEAVAWVMSPHAGLFVFAPAKSEQANAALQPQFDQFLSSIRFP
jgi:hypothetical protein